MRVPLRRPLPILLVGGKKNQPIWVVKKFKTPIPKPQNLGPQSLEKQKIGKRVETQSKGDDEIKMDIPLNVDLEEFKKDEMDIDILLVNSNSN